MWKKQPCKLMQPITVFLDKNLMLIFTLVGMIVVCIMFLNLPMEGSTSSGLMISSSSENATELTWLLRFRGLSTSVIPTIEICLLWAVLYWVRSYQIERKRKKFNETHLAPLQCIQFLYKLEQQSIWLTSTSLSSSGSPRSAPPSPTSPPSPSPSDISETIAWGRSRRV